jgi:hypothetical protein
MKRPSVIIRRGDRFEVIQSRLYPHLRRQEDMVRTALHMVCLHYKSYPQEYNQLAPKDQLDKVNDLFYQILKDWGIYKGK